MCVLVLVVFNWARTFAAFLFCLNMLVWCHQLCSEAMPIFFYAHYPVSIVLLWIFLCAFCVPAAVLVIAWEKPLLLRMILCQNFFFFLVVSALAFHTSQLFFNVASCHHLFLSSGSFFFFFSCWDHFVLVVLVVFLCQFLFCYCYFCLNQKLLSCLFMPWRSC